MSVLRNAVCDWSLQLTGGRDIPVDKSAFYEQVTNVKVLFLLFPS
jgi:hypothetical protein